MLKRIAGTIFRKIPLGFRRKVIRAGQNKFTASVAAIIINEKREVLLLDHVLRPQPGWAIPGGFMNFGEQPADAVRREIIEETGLQLKELEMFRVRAIGRHIEILFRAEADGIAAVKSLEINAVGWFTAADLPEQMRAAEKSMILEILQNS